MSHREKWTEEVATRGQAYFPLHDSGPGGARWPGHLGRSGARVPIYHPHTDAMQTGGLIRAQCCVPRLFSRGPLEQVLPQPHR